jgi:hypothetical protein
MVPHDIDPYSPTKDSWLGGESLKADKPLTPRAAKLLPRLQSPRARVELKTPPAQHRLRLLVLRRLPAQVPPMCLTTLSWLNPPRWLPQAPSLMDSARLVESLGGDLARPQPGGLPQQNPWVVEILSEDLEFIKAGFHIGRFISTMVDTEAKRTNTEVLQTDLTSASTRINVSNLCLIIHYHYCLILTPPFLSRNWLSILDKRPIPKSCPQEAYQNSTFGRWVERGEWIKQDSPGS